MDEKQIEQKKSELDEKIAAAQKLNPELQRMENMNNWFSSNDIWIKTDFNAEQRAAISLLRGYSQYRGGLPGVDEALYEFALTGRSLNRRSSLEWVEAFKAAVVNLGSGLFRNEGQATPGKGKWYDFILGKK